MEVSKKFINYLRMGVADGTPPNVPGALDAFAHQIVGEWVPKDANGEPDLDQGDPDQFVTVGVMFNDASMVLFQHKRTGEAVILEIERNVVEQVLVENFEGRELTDYDHYAEVVHKTIEHVEGGKAHVQDNSVLYETPVQH